MEENKSVNAADSAVSVNTNNPTGSTAASVPVAAPKDNKTVMIVGIVALVLVICGGLCAGAWAFISYQQRKALEALNEDGGFLDQLADITPMMDSEDIDSMMDSLDTIIMGTDITVDPDLTYTALNEAGEGDNLKLKVTNAKFDSTTGSVTVSLDISNTGNVAKVFKPILSLELHKKPDSDGKSKNYSYYYGDASSDNLVNANEVTIQPGKTSKYTVTYNLGAEGKNLDNFYLEFQPDFMNEEVIFNMELK